MVTEKIIFKGLESARTDWTPLAQQFQQTLYEMVFQNKGRIEYLITLNGPEPKEY